MFAQITSGSPPEFPLPTFFYVAAMLWVGLAFEAFIKRDRGLGIVSLVVYFTVALWYAADLFVTPEVYAFYPESAKDDAFLQVAWFMICYRMFSHRWSLDPDPPAAPATIPAEVFLAAILPIWAVLLGWGIIRMDGSIPAALWPVSGRNGPYMWNRAAIGGTFDSLVSVASYVYILVCGMFGLLAVVATQSKTRTTCIMLMLISWPFFFLLGVRNQLLAVVMPGFFAYLFIAGKLTLGRIMNGVIMLLALNFLMIAMLQFRQGGFQEFLNHPFSSVDKERKHEGLNMIEELIFMNQAYDKGQLKLALGTDYLAHAATVVPRVFWADKPKISVEYSMIRGQVEGEGGNVTATIATGLIGQGFINFGGFGGPIAAAGLMAWYAGWLCRQWKRRGEIPRLALFLVGMGLLPNLGREFTLLVLWPLVFGYALVLLFERREAAKAARETNARPTGVVLP